MEAVKDFLGTVYAYIFFLNFRIHMTRERSGLLRLSMAFVEESDIGTYGLRVFNQHGEAKCEAALVYDGLEVRPGQSLGMNVFHEKNNISS